MGCTFRNAGGFKAFVYPIHTQVALHRLAVIGVLYRDVPWTCRFTSHTTDTLLLVYEDDTVISLDHGICRTDGDAKRILAVTAGGKGDLKARDTTNLFKRSGADIAEKWPYR